MQLASKNRKNGDWYGHTKEQMESVCGQLGIGISTLKEFSTQLSMIKPNQIAGKTLDGKPIVPRIIMIPGADDDSSGHISLALDWHC